MSHPDDAPSIREIGDLVARLRQLTTAGADADPAERAAFLADKQALIARIEAANRADAKDATVADGCATGSEDRTDGQAVATDNNAGTDGRLLPPWPVGWLPPEMLDGIEERRARPAEADDPAELAARLHEGQQRIAARDRATTDDARVEKLAHGTTQDQTRDNDADGDDASTGW